MAATDQRMRTREQVSNAIAEAERRLQDARELLAAAGLQHPRVALQFMKARDEVASLADVVREVVVDA